MDRRRPGQRRQGGHVVLRPAIPGTGVISGGFDATAVRPSMFLERGKVFIFGREPVRIDILTSPSGLDFASSYRRRNVVTKWLSDAKPTA